MVMKVWSMLAMLGERGLVGSLLQPWSHYVESNNSLRTGVGGEKDSRVALGKK